MKFLQQQKILRGANFEFDFSGHFFFNFQISKSKVNVYFCRYKMKLQKIKIYIETMTTFEKNVKAKV